MVVKKQTKKEIAQQAKQDRAVQLYHNLVRFQDAMKQYTDLINTVRICEHRKQTTLKNEDGMRQSDVQEAIRKWTDHITKSQAMADQQMSIAVECSEKMKSLFT